VVAIGVDSFSYHRYFGDPSPYEQPVSIRWTVDDFLGRVAALGVSMVSLQSLYLPTLDPQAAPELRAKLGGLQPVIAWGHPSGLNGGADPQQVQECKQALDFARALGCDLVRFVTGNQYTISQPAQPRLERLIPILHELVAHADALGLLLAWENHADFKMVDIVRTIENIAAPRLGICFDMANTVRVGDDLLQAAHLAAPYIRMVHCRDMVIPPQADDPTAFWAAAKLGEGDLPIEDFFNFLLGQGYGGGIFMEITNIHPRYTDEDDLVASGVAYLKARFGMV